MSMKKMFVVLVAVVLMGVTNVDAMTIENLKAKLTASYPMSHMTVKASPSQANLIDRYFRECTVTEAQADIIAEEFDKALQVIREANVSSYKQLSRASRQKLINIANEITSRTGIKIVLRMNGEFEIYKPNGELFYSGKMTDDDIIKQTGSNDIVLLSGGISLLGVLYYFASKFKKVSQN